VGVDPIGTRRPDKTIYPYLKVTFVISVRKNLLPIFGLALTAGLFVGCGSDSGEVVIPDTAPPESAPIGAGVGESDDLSEKPPKAPGL